MKQHKINSNNINAIKELAKKLKYWKLQSVKFTFEFVGEDTQEFMRIEGFDFDDHPLYIKRSSNNIYSNHKIEPIIEGHKLLQEIEKLL